MKPKDLRYPYTWNERKVCYEHGVIFVPDHFYDFECWKFPGFSDMTIFSNDHPVYLEYCSGNGEWIVEKAKQNPHINWVAIEKRFDRVRKIWARKHREKISNLLIVFSEADKFTQHYIPDNSISKVFINFPDPWPKNKHAKHRLCNPLFLSSVSDRLKLEGSITLVTDHCEYRDFEIESAFATQKLESTLPFPYYTLLDQTYGYSYFNDLWSSHGLSLFRTEFKKKPPLPQEL